MNKRKIIFECACRDIEHALIFDLDTSKEGFPLLSAFVYLWYGLPFWKRVRNAIKYIFGYKSKYGDFGEFLLNDGDEDDIITLLTTYKSLKSKPEAL